MQLEIASYSSCVKRKYCVERAPRVFNVLAGYFRAAQNYAAIAQLVERIHGKDEVQGSNPCRGSTIIKKDASASLLLY